MFSGWLPPACAISGRPPPLPPTSAQSDFMRSPALILPVASLVTPATRFLSGPVGPMPGFWTGFRRQKTRICGTTTYLPRWRNFPAPVRAWRHSQSQGMSGAGLRAQALYHLPQRHTNGEITGIGLAQAFILCRGEITARLCCCGVARQRVYLGGRGQRRIGRGDDRNRVLRRGRRCFCARVILLRRRPAIKALMWRRVQ